MEKTIFETKTESMNLHALIVECDKEIDFESEILKVAPNMTLQELGVEIDRRLNGIMDSTIDDEAKERLKKEARRLSLMILRRNS